MTVVLPLREETRQETINRIYFGRVQYYKKNKTKQNPGPHDGYMHVRGRGEGGGWGR